MQNHYCGLSSVGCFLDTALQIQIFMFLAIYGLKFIQMIDEPMSYRHNITHYSKLAIEFVLLSLNTVSLIFMVIDSNRIYYLVFRYASNMIIWVIIMIITKYEHQSIGVTSLWFKILIFSILCDTTIQLLLEQLFVYEVEESFPTLFFIQQFLVLCFYGLLNMNPYDVAKNEEPISIQMNAVTISKQISKKQSLETPLLSLSAPCKQLLQAYSSGLGEIFLQQITILRVQDFTQYTINYKYQDCYKTTTKDIKDILILLDNLKNFNFQNINFTQLDHFYSTLNEGQDYKLAITQRPLIQDYFDQMLLQPETDEILSMFLNQNNKNFELFLHNHLNKTEEKKIMRLSSSRTESSLIVSPLDSSMDFICRIENSIRSGDFNKIKVTINEDNNEYVINLQKSDQQNITFYKSFEEVKDLLDQLVLKHEFNQKLHQCAQVFLALPNGELGQIYLENTLQTLLL